MQGAMRVDQAEDAVDELLALEVADFTQCELAAEMIVAVGVTPGAAQRALAGDLDLHGGRVAGKDAAPRAEDPFHPSTIT